MCSPDKVPNNSCVVTYDDLVETEIEIQYGNPYFVAKTLDGKTRSLCCPSPSRLGFLLACETIKIIIIIASSQCSSSRHPTCCGRPKN